MMRHTSKLLAAVVIASLAGCSGPPSAVRSRDSARLIEPQGPARLHTGTLVARVDGQPRDIEYYVNGIRIEPDAEWAWWRDARLELELQPGLYRLEARYRIRGFAGDKAVGRILTRGAVEVTPGGRVELAADLRKNWRGVPEERVSYFRVLRGAAAGGDAATSAAAADPEHSSARVPVEIVPPPPEALAREDAAPRPPAPEVVIRDDPGAPDDIVIQGTERLTRPAADAIVIRGDQVVARGWRHEASSAAPPAGAATTSDTPAEPGGAAPGTVELPSDDEPTHEELPASAASGGADAGAVHIEDAAPPTLEAGATRVALVLRSDPPGAHVSLDERYVGRTPLRLHIDPTRDHVLQFERQGCLEHVQLLSSRSWLDGRSPVLEVELECR
jgi:hypothetical protein